jgi:hypothetical protein
MSDTFASAVLRKGAMAYGWQNYLKYNAYYGYGKANSAGSITWISATDMFTNGPWIPSNGAL